MSKVKRRRLRYNAAIAVFTLIVVIATAVIIGSTITQVTKNNMMFTDDMIAGIYLLTLTLLYPLVSYVQPRARR